jgi:hypothetical protein
LNSLMLPSAKALMGCGPTGLSTGHVPGRVREFLFGLALHIHQDFRSLRCNGTDGSPGLLKATMASADFPRAEAKGISPGKNALLPCATAAFTSTAKPVDFAVWCQLIPPCRPFMRFLFIGSQVSPSLPPPGWLPFQSWLQVVVVAALSFITCMVFRQGTLTPFAARPCWAHTSRWSGPALRLGCSKDLKLNFVTARAAQLVSSATE